MYTVPDSIWGVFLCKNLEYGMFCVPPDLCTEIETTVHVIETSPKQTLTVPACFTLFTLSQITDENEQKSHQKYHFFLFIYNCVASKYKLMPVEAVLVRKM